MNSSKELMVGEKPLASLRVVDLKEELEKRGLSKSGSKKDLAERLKNFLLAEKQKEIPVLAAAADEEQLPNISMQEKLAEQNPFIRDYFASQAELFHSQKVAKKLLEEEARRESETSAPSADEESSAPEDKSPSKETEVQKGKVKRLARRFENQSRGSKVEEESIDMTVDKPSIEEMPEISIGKPVEIDSERTAKQKNVEVTEAPIAIAKKSEPELVVSDKPEDKDEIKTESEESSNDNEASGVDLTVRVSKEDSEAQQVKDVPANDAQNDSSSVSSSSPDPEPEQLEVKSEPESLSVPAKSPEKVAPATDVTDSRQPEESALLKEQALEVSRGGREISKNGNVRKLAERFEAPVARELDTVEVEKPTEKHEEGPVEKGETPIETKSSFTAEKAKTPVEIKSSLPDEEPEDNADSESSESSRSRSPKVRRAGSSTHSPPTHKDSSPEDDRKKTKVTDSYDKKSDDASRDEELEISMEADDQIEMGPTRNGDTDKLKQITPLKKQGTVIQIKTRSEDETRSSQRKLPELIDDEDALDYGEEEKLKIEPARFTWSKRILRLKNKHPSKEHSGKRWKMPDDMNSPIINTEYLMQWFPEVKLAPASEFKLEDREKTPPPASTTDKEVENIEIIRTVSVDSVEQNQTSMENITITRKVSLIPMVPSAPSEDVDKDLSPPRHPPSELILITNLTRPFTLPQLKELLQRTGNLLDVWVDKIKSRCIAKYEKQEEAFETRAALHGVNWPQSNPKTLSVDYTTQERLDDYQARDAGVDVKPVRIDKPETADNTMPVREWDMGKRGKSRSPHRVRKSSRSASRERKRPRRSQSPGLNRRRHSRSPHHDRRSRGDAKDAEPLGKALDELFRKTIATPSIYWLPLTPQQISEKEELRRKRMIERERRLAEMSKMRPR